MVSVCLVGRLSCDARYEGVWHATCPVEGGESHGAETCWMGLGEHAVLLGLLLSVIAGEVSGEVLGRLRPSWGDGDAGGRGVGRDSQ